MPLPVPILSLSGLWSLLVTVYGWCIFFYVLMTWIPDAGPFEPVRGILKSVCEPYIGIFRRFIPPIDTGTVGIDVSAVVAWLALSWLIRPLVSGILRAVGL